MTIEQIIKLFENIEKGVGGQKIGFHLHRAIQQAIAQPWYTQTYPATFSGFLTALKNESPEI